jgi:tRNA (cmo5U34)-methyltransferase
MTNKSTVDEIRARFDADVERFSDASVGQRAAIDSLVGLDLICRGAALATPGARDVLDVGCGAGNWTIKLLERLPRLNATLLDLSRPMLDRAQARVVAAGGTATCVQGDVRGVAFADASFDLIVAGSVLHHLRGDAEWHATFAAFHRWLRPGGSAWVYDMVSHESPAIQSLMWERYGDYLAADGGAAYRDKVFAYIDAEDTPRPATFQLDALRAAGFAHVDLVHKNSPFAVIAATRRRDGLRRSDDTHATNVERFERVTARHGRSRGRVTASDAARCSRAARSRPRTPRRGRRCR